MIEAELPGVNQDTLDIFVTGDKHLSIKGERKPQAADQGLWHRQERATGTFARTLTLPFEVDGDRVEAKLENGVLTLRLAKHQAAKPRKINVKAE